MKLLALGRVGYIYSLFKVRTLNSKSGIQNLFPRLLQIFLQVQRNIHDQPVNVSTLALVMAVLS